MNGVGDRAVDRCEARPCLVDAAPAAGAVPAAVWRRARRHGAAAPDSHKVGFPTSI